MFLRVLNDSCHGYTAPTAAGFRPTDRILSAQFSLSKVHQNLGQLSRDGGSGRMARQPATGHPASIMDTASITASLSVI